MGTGATARAYLLFPEHFKFTNCDVDSFCQLKCTPFILQVTAEQFFNDASGIKKFEEVKMEAKAYLAMHNTAMHSRREVVWPTRQGFTAGRSLPSHIIFLLYQYHGDMELHEAASQQCITMSSDK